MKFLYKIKYFVKKLIPTKWYIMIQYKYYYGKKLNLKNPKLLSEKIQWLKLYNKNPEYIHLIDKYEVRKHISNIIGEQHLNPLLGLYNSFEEINFDILPNEFVLKPNHTSGDIFICRDKSKIDLEQLEKQVNKWIKINFYWAHREWPYKNIKPKILCEKFMIDEGIQELMDYKFMCFHGKPKFCVVCLNRNVNVNMDIYDMKWERMPFRWTFPNSRKSIPQPINFEKMIEISKQLSKNIPLVRVDLYEVNGQIFFGELTFYPCSGFINFIPQKYDKIFGSWLELPRILNRGLHIK